MAHRVRARHGIRYWGTNQESVDCVPADSRRHSKVVNHRAYRAHPNPENIDRWLGDSADLGDCRVWRARFLGCDRRASDGRTRRQEFRARTAAVVVSDGAAADAVAVDPDSTRAMARLA